MSAWTLGRGKWVFVDWMGIWPGYGKDQQGRDLPFGFLVPLVWRKQLGCLRGKSGQLHFELVEADLFAVTFGG